MSNSIAYWNVELTVECPHCELFFDLLDDPDFWDGRQGLQVGEHRKNIDVFCPECLEEFTVDLEY